MLSILAVDIGDIFFSQKNKDQAQKMPELQIKRVF